MRNTVHPKQFSEPCGKLIITCTSEIFQSYPSIDAIIVLCVNRQHDRLRDMTRKLGITELLKIVPGGETSQESKLSALRTLKDICSDRDITFIHDAVRPLIIPQVISDNTTNIKAFGSAIVVNLFTETGTISSDDKTVETTIEWQGLYTAKMSRSFYYRDVLAAHEAAVDIPDLTVIDMCIIMTTLGK